MAAARAAARIHRPGTARGLAHRPRRRPLRVRRDQQFRHRPFRAVTARHRVRAARGSRRDQLPDLPARRLCMDLRACDRTTPGHAVGNHRCRHPQAAPARAARQPHVRAHAAAGTAVRGDPWRRVVHDAGRAGCELLPVRAAAGMAPCPAGSGHCRRRIRVRAAGAVRALDLRDAHRDVPPAEACGRAARERAHARGTTAAIDHAAAAVVAGPDGDGRPLLPRRPSFHRSRDELGRRRSAARPAAGRAVHGRDHRLQLRLRNAAVCRPPVPGDPHVRRTA